MTRENDWEPLTCESLMEAIKTLTDCPPPGPTMIYANGTGIPCEMLVECYNGTGILIKTRDGSIWKNGEKIS